MSLYGMYIYISYQSYPKFTNLQLKVSRHEWRFSSNSKTLNYAKVLVFLENRHWWRETLSSKFVNFGWFRQNIIALPYLINVLSTLMPDISTLITNMYIYVSLGNIHVSRLVFIVPFTKWVIEASKQIIRGTWKWKYYNHNFKQ